MVVLKAEQWAEMRAVHSAAAKAVRWDGCLAGPWADQWAAAKAARWDDSTVAL